MTDSKSASNEPVPEPDAPAPDAAELDAAEPVTDGTPASPDPGQEIANLAPTPVPGLPAAIADPPDGQRDDGGAVARPTALLAVPVSGPIVALTLLVTIVFLMFLLIEPTSRWIALFGSALAALAMDGVLRSARRAPFEADTDTTPYLFLPALFVLAAPVFIEHNVRGFWAAPAGVAAGLAFGAVAVAEVASVREFDPAKGVGRFVASAATYFVAFALFSLAYRFELELQQAMVAVALVSVLLAVEMLREGEIDPLETLVFAVVTALVVAEVRWTLFYLPLDGYLAGLTLLLTFYFVTGLLHSHLTSHLSAFVAAEYALIAAAGIGLVVWTRAAGLA